MTNQTTTPRISANTNQRTRVLTYTALMAAISTVVMFFEFTFPPFPPFLKFDLSGLPILLTAFIMGPVQAIIGHPHQGPVPCPFHHHRRCG